MIVLDTEVLSEFLRPKPSQDVIAWMDAQPRLEMTVTAVTAFEMLSGAARLAEARTDDGWQRRSPLSWLRSGRECCPSTWPRQRMPPNSQPSGSGSGVRSQCRTPRLPASPAREASRSRRATRATSRTPASNSSTPGERRGAHASVGTCSVCAASAEASARFLRCAFAGRMAGTSPTIGTGVRCSRKP